MIKPSRANQITEHVATRSQTMTVERLAADTFRVTPSEPGKRTRLVVFHVDGDDFGIECFTDDEEREDCEANGHARMCSHC